MPTLQDVRDQLAAALALVDAALTPVPPVDPIPDPPPDPPPPPTLIPVRGAQNMNKQFDAGPADWLHPELAVGDAGLLDTLPNAVIGTSRKGGARHGAGYMVIPYTGNPGSLYAPDPALDGTSYPQRGSDPVEIVKGLTGTGSIGDMGTRPAAYRPIFGKRGASRLYAYIAWRGHPRTRLDGTMNLSPKLPMWVGVTILGDIVFADREGTLTRAFTITGLRGALDFSMNPVQRMHFYIVDTVGGRLVHIDRTNEGSPPDPEKWIVSFGQKAFVRPTSVRVTDAEVMWLVDGGNGNIYRDGVMVTNIPNAFWVDYTSTLDVVVATRGAGLFLLDGTTGALIRVLRPTDSNIAQWVTVSVDRGGHFGVVDDMAMIRDVGGGGDNFSNTEGWWVAKDGSYIAGFRKIFPGNGIAAIGDAAFCKDPHGHYPWTFEFHPEEAAALVQGFATAHPAIIRPKQSTDPALDAYDHNLFNAGRRIIMSGTARGFSTMHRPSFTQQMTENVGGLLVNADTIAGKSFDEMRDWIQQGMAGSTPRPEITAQDLYALMYVIYRSSQRWLREGKTLISALTAWAKPQSTTTLPVMTPRGSRVNSDGSVTWFIDTDVPTFCYVAAGGGSRQYYRWTKMSGPSLSHAVTLVDPPDNLMASLRVRTLGGAWVWRGDNGVNETPADYLPTEVVDYPTATQVELAVVAGQVTAKFSAGYPERPKVVSPAPPIRAIVDAGTPNEQDLGRLPVSYTLTGTHTLYAVVLAPGYRPRPSIVTTT